MNVNAFILPAAIILAIGVAAIIVVSLLGKIDLLKLKITDLERDLECVRKNVRSTLSGAALDMQFKSARTVQQCADKRLSERIDKVERKANAALTRLGVDPHTGGTYSYSFDARPPEKKAEDAMSNGDVALAMIYMREAYGEQHASKSRRNSVETDFVHYIHGDCAQGIVKAAGITEPGCHAVVVNVAKAG